MSFLYPIYLWALAGISLPFLIHLFSRKKGKPTFFPSIKFLKDAQSITGKKKRVEEILILLLRMFILFLLLLILSVPILKTRSPFTQKGDIVFLIDDSYSINAIDKDNPTEKYHTTLTETLSFIKRPARVALVYLSGEVYPFTQNYSEINSILKKKGISFQAGNLSLGISNAIKLLEREENEKVICFFTDLQKNLWKDISIPDFNKKNIKLLIFDIGQPDTSNVGFKKMYLSSSASTLKADIQNWGEEDTSAEIKVNSGKEEKSVNILLKARSVKSVEFDIIQPQSKITGYINNKDILEVDNKFYFHPGSVSDEKVLLIGEKEESFYINKALEVVTEKKREVVNILPRNTKNIFFENYSTLFISSNEKFYKGFSEKIYRYVNDGGNLVSFPANRTLAAEFNQNWQPTETSIPFFMPARLKYAKTLNITSKIGNATSSHSIFLPLKEVIYQYTRSINFKKCFYIDKLSGDVLMETSEGYPLLVEKKLGKGRILLFTFPINDSWTNMHYRPFFPVLINNIIEYLTDKETENFIAGKEIKIKTPYNTNLVYLYSPDGEKKELEKTSSGEVFFNPPKPGFWRLEFFNLKEKVEKIIPVNLEPTEGDLTKTDVKEVSRKLGGAKVYIVKKEEIREFLSRRNKTKEISGEILNILFVLFILEVILIILLPKQREKKEDVKNKF